jgi:hypothetical protein
MLHLRPGSSDLGLVASNAIHYFFKLAAYLRLRVAGLFSNRDFQMSKLFVDIDELETNLSTEFIYMRTHGEPLAGIHPTPPALLCRVETETSEARQICENSCKATRGGNQRTQCLRSCGRTGSAKRQLSFHSTWSCVLQSLVTTIVWSGEPESVNARRPKQSIGVTPHRYLTQKRVERAPEMLAQTDLSLSEIAYVTGFFPTKAIWHVISVTCSVLRLASFGRRNASLMTDSLITTAIALGEGKRSRQSAAANPINTGSAFRIFRNRMVAFEYRTQRADLLQQPLGVPDVQTARVQNTTRNVHCPLAELSPDLCKIDADLAFIGRIAAPVEMA